MRSSMACSPTVAAAAILFPNSPLRASSFQQFRRQQPCPAVRRCGHHHGARRLGRGDLRPVVVRSGVEQGQDGADEMAGRHAGKRLDGVGPHARVGRMRQAVEQPDIAPAAQRRLDHQHAPDDPPVAGRQCGGKHLDQFPETSSADAPKPRMAAKPCRLWRACRYSGRRWSSSTCWARRDPIEPSARMAACATSGRGDRSRDAASAMAASPKRPSASAAA